MVTITVVGKGLIMDNYGFFECSSSAEVMEVLERLSIEDLVKVEARYSCSGSALADQIMKSKGLTDSQIDNILIRLKQREVDEQIRSNKVVEGVLQDIWAGVDTVAKTLGDINIRDEMIYTFNERDIMNEKGNELAGQDGGGNKDQFQHFDKLVDLENIATLLKNDNNELVIIANHIRLIDEALRLIMEQVTGMNQRMEKISKIILSFAEAEATKEPPYLRNAPRKKEPEPEFDKDYVPAGLDEPEPDIDYPEKPEKPKPEAEKAETVQIVEDAMKKLGVAPPTPVHSIRFTDKLAICGAQGSAVQPYAPRKNEKVTSTLSEITCPECLKIIAMRVDESKDS